MATFECSGSGNPVIQKRSGSWFTRLLPQLPEVFLEVIGCGKGAIQTQCLFQPLFLVVLRGEMFRILQQQPAGSFEDLFPGALCLPLQFPAKFGQFVVEQFDEMKMIKDDCRPRQVGQYRGNIGRRHIDNRGTPILHYTRRRRTVPY